MSDERDVVADAEAIASRVEDKRLRAVIRDVLSSSPRIMEIGRNPVPGSPARNVWTVRLGPRRKVTPDLLDRALRVVHLARCEWTYGNTPAQMFVVGQLELPDLPPLNLTFTMPRYQGFLGNVCADGVEGADGATRGVLALTTRPFWPNAERTLGIDLGLLPIDVDNLATALNASALSCMAW